MLYERKTKDTFDIRNLLLPIGTLIIFFGVSTYAGFALGFYSLGAIVIVISISPFITYSKTRNPGFLIQGMYLVFLGLMCLTSPPAFEDKSKIGLTPVFLVLTYVTLLLTAFQFFNRKIKWRGMEILELAALNVEDIGESFSPRPRPSGQVRVSKTEMIRFVDFINSNLIAFPFQEENRSVLVLALPKKISKYILGIQNDYLSDTWVAIDFEGQVSVNVTQEDYLLYKQDFDFDQICLSLGNVFIEFLELSKEGKESQIIDKMNMLRLSPFV